MTRPQKPFAKRRIVYTHNKSRLVHYPATSPVAKLAQRMEGRTWDLGLYVSPKTYLDYSKEESLEATAATIQQHYDFVRRELEQPFLILLGGGDPR